MPLFELANAKSLEAPAMHALADRLSECASFQELAEAANAAEALAKISIGPQPGPFDSEEFTIDELEEQLLWSSVDTSDDEGHEAVLADTTTECPNEGGNFTVEIRRQVRKFESQDDAGKSDVYLYFLDRCSAIAHELFEKSEAAGFNPRLVRIPRVFSPSFASNIEEVGQGEFIWTLLNVEWGNLDLTRS